MASEMESIVESILSKLPEGGGKDWIELCKNTLIYMENYEIFTSLLPVDSSIQQAYLCVLLTRYTSKIIDDKILSLEAVLTLSKTAGFYNLLSPIVTMTAAIELETNTIEAMRLITDFISEFIESDIDGFQSDDASLTKITGLRSMLYPLLDKKLKSVFNSQALLKKLWSIAVVSSSSNMYQASIEVIRILCNFSAVKNETLISVIKTELSLEARERLYVILCDLVDHIFDQSNRDVIVNFLETSSLLQILYTRAFTVSKKAASNCKRTFFLLRKVLDFVGLCNVDFITDLIVYDPTEASHFEDAWDVFFTIIETMQGNQRHLIIPSLGLLPKLEYLGIKWKALLVERGLQSESKAVRYWCVNFLLDQSDIANLIRTDTFTAAINDTCLFDKEVMDTKKFKEFIKHFPDNVTITALQKPLPIYYVSMALLDLIRAKIPQDNIFETLSTDKDCLEFVITQFNLVVQTLKLCQNTAIRQRISDACFRVFSDKELFFWIEELRNLDLIKCEKGRVVKINDYETWTKIRDSQLPCLLKSAFDFPCTACTSQNIYARTYDKFYSFNMFTYSNWLIGILRDEDYGHEPEQYEKLLKLIITRFDRIGSLVHEPEQYEKLLKVIITRFDEIGSLGCARKKFNEQLIEFIRNKNTPVLQRLCALKSVTYSQNGSQPCLDLYRNCFNTKTNIHEFVRLCNSNGDNDQLLEIYDAVSKYRESIARYVDFTATNDVEAILDSSLELIHRGSVNALISEICYLSFLLKNATISTQEAEHVCDTIFNSVMNERRSKLFKEVVKRFLEMIAAVQWDIYNFKQIATKYYKPFLELFPAMVRNEFLKTINFITKERVNIPTEILEVAVDILLFNHVKTKDQMLENELVYDFSECTSFSEYLNKFREKTRLNEDLKQMLLRNFYEESKKHPRYFADTQTHRTKLKICQYLAYFSCRSVKTSRAIHDALFKENNQSNVTILLELIISCASDEDFIYLLQPKFYLKLQPAALQSLFIIMYYRCQKDLGDIELHRECIKIMLPFTMGTHFATRLYAQVIIQRLASTLPEEFALIAQTINELQTSHPDKNLNRVKDDCRWKIFESRNNSKDDIFSFRNIFYEIPRITRMSKDFYQDFQAGNQTFLSNIPPMPITKRADPAEIHTGTDNVQVKIIPRKQINLNANELDDFPPLTVDRKLSTQSELIIVASLLNKMPNLGGLARTCEIFNVKLYVISSVKHLESHEFQSLSVTAEKWLNVAEVQPWQVGDYLRSMKEKGYVVVGAEQTANSQLITQFSFPKKCLLLMGEEREGIPANLISLLDHAVEVPQLGVTRSLNVHVCASLFVWEYVKQHQL